MERIADTSYATLNLRQRGYDELGRLKRRYRHNGTDTESFEYNIRNWTTQIRSGEFIQRLYYNTPPRNFWAIPQFAGNISATTWTFGNRTNGYVFQYDGLNRLAIAYMVFNGHMCDIRSEMFHYDMNGNITWLQRWGENDIIDMLSMTYRGNQLMRVTDSSWGPQNLYNLMEYHDRNRIGDDFAYDYNGNMIKDLDRNIVTIQYNFLNLPSLIQFRNGHQIMNIYAADGRKLETRFRTVSQCLFTPRIQVPVGEIANLDNINTHLSGTIYAGNIEYRYQTWRHASEPYRIHNPEGFASFCPLRGENHWYSRPNPLFNYFRRDHLGNVREVWRAPHTKYIRNYDKHWNIYWWTQRVEGQTIQRTQFTTTGIPWEQSYGRHQNNRLHNSTELIEMHGYNSSDHGNRRLHHAINRYVTIDRLAEQFPWQSPYVHAANNPVNFIDVNGDAAVSTIIIGGLIWGGKKIAAASAAKKASTLLLAAGAAYYLPDAIDATRDLGGIIRQEFVTASSNSGITILSKSKGKGGGGDPLGAAQVLGHANMIAPLSNPMPCGGGFNPDPNQNHSKTIKRTAGAVAVGIGMGQISSNFDINSASNELQNRWRNALDHSLQARPPMLQPQQTIEQQPQQNLLQLPLQNQTQPHSFRHAEHERRMQELQRLF